MSDAAIRIPAWDGTPRECGEVWTLKKSQRIARCSFWTHPRGGEARLTVNDEWLRGSVSGDGRTVLDLALHRKEQFEGKGWQ